MKLYNWQFAPNCRRVRMFVLEKNLDLPAIEEVIGSGLRLLPEYIDRWPHAMVPMLETDEGASIGEAMAICRYFEERFPEPNLMGRTAVEKGTIEMWERRAYDECLIGTAEVFRNSHPEFVDRGLPGTTAKVPQIPALIERGKGRVARYYPKLETQLADNEWVAGARFSVADITTLCAMDFAIAVDMPIPDTCPATRRWYEQVNQRPTAKQSV
ncbi:glutathione S-transferase family protein [Panacagrimonas sp.]|uniref:glutathione S-transferase family protein n=1 Tax=Panacagrimonas sp. TaxID=2480088 RepID=UPI003B528822